MNSFYKLFQAPSIYYFIDGMNIFLKNFFLNFYKKYPLFLDSIFFNLNQNALWKIIPLICILFLIVFNLTAFESYLKLMNSIKNFITNSGLTSITKIIASFFSSFF